MQSSREFDLVVLGATGYTGKLCAEHIVQHLPTNLKWALVGRSYEKVEKVAQEIRTLSPDRNPPGISPSDHVAVHRHVNAAVDVVEIQMDNGDELHDLALSTTVLINCVGPYVLYSEPVVEACASNGTHYIDAYDPSRYTCADFR